MLPESVWPRAKGEKGRIEDAVNQRIRAEWHTWPREERKARYDALVAELVPPEWTHSNILTVASRGVPTFFLMKYKGEDV